MEEYMESELSGIFRVKLVTKNIERGSPGNQFMHMRAKGEVSYTCLRISHSPLTYSNHKCS